nr:antileukoproteinase-like [Kogia breviceps]
MQSSSLTVFLVIFAFGFLMPWPVEGGLREKFKPGSCPFVRPAKFLRYDPPECQSDWQCPKKQKCCYDYCGLKCMDPVDTTKTDSFVPFQKD